MGKMRQINLEWTCKVCLLVQKDETWHFCGDYNKLLILVMMIHQN
jgi:hypothetical protein